MCGPAVASARLSRRAKEPAMRVPAAVLTGALLMSPLAGAQVAPPDHHPIVGIWKLSLPDLGCSETYRFRPDGTTLVTSAQEISESEYRIPAKPSAKGYYRLEDRITKDNGKKDCAG